MKTQVAIIGAAPAGLMLGHLLRAERLHALEGEPSGALTPEYAVGLFRTLTLEVLRARSLSGFELPALEMAHKAMERAQEQGVLHILLVDPSGLLPLAKVNRYAR